jgi:hypothetical protein
VNLSICSTLTFPKPASACPHRFSEDLSAPDDLASSTFYIAGQNAICGGDPSSLLMIRPEGAICLPGGQLFSSDYDVAASTVVLVAYTTRPDGVWAWSQ